MLHITGSVIHSKADTLVMDCATGGGATSGGTITGGVIDRLSLGRHYSYAAPFVIGTLAGNTSTTGSKTAKLDVFLKHGDSSGGGDLAEVSTGLRVAQQQIYNTGELTTDYKSYATADLSVQHTGAYYHLLGVKRWIAPAAIVTRAGLSTATTGANALTVSLGAIMHRPDEDPPTRKAIFRSGSQNALYATSTST
jgi:hypothetical protein